MDPSQVKRLCRWRGAALVGYVDFCYADDDSGERNVDVKYLWTDPEHRREGVATAVMGDLLDKLTYEDIVWVSLWTGAEAEVDGSWPIYAKLGFTQTALLADYYDTNIPARLFVKRLN